MRLPKRFSKGLLLGLLSFCLPLVVQAQTGQPKVYIHEVRPPQEVTTSTGAIGLSLETFFSLLDANDQIMLAPEIVDASFELGGDSYPVVVQELEIPWTVIFVVDASRTLGGLGPTYKNFKNALMSSVSEVPDNAKMAVISFDDAAPMVQDFVQDAQPITNAINKLTAKTFGSSCMNNAINEAVNKLSGASGRKAIILLTASADDCADRTSQDVVSLAQQNRVQIYPVGLQGYSITKTELDALALPTGGVAELRDEGNLGFGLSNITGVMHSQWTSKATIYPKAGENTLTLEVNLSDATTLTSQPFTITSTQDYIPPTEIRLKGKVLSVEGGLLFNLDLFQQAQIRQLNVSVISSDTGQSVVAQSLVSFSEVNTVPAVGLVAGSEYTLIVTAIDSDGQVLSEDSAEFEYEPPQARLTITEIQPPSVSQDDFQVSVSTLNIGGAVKFRAWLANEETRAKIEGTEITVPLGEDILIPGADVKSGEYIVIVQALDSSDTVITESPPTVVIYKSPSIFESLQNWASESPMATAAITGLCCLSVLGVGGIVWYVLPRRRAKMEAVDLVMPQKERRVTPGLPRAMPTPPRAEKRKEPARPERIQEKEAPKPRPKPPVREAKPPVKPAVKEPVESRPAPPVAKPPEPMVKAPADMPPAAPPPAAPPAAPPAVTPPAAPPPRVEVSVTPSARVSLIMPPLKEFTADMTGSPFAIGRRKDNDAVIPLDASSGVSGHHLTLLYQNGQYFAQDDKSTYGTTVNGVEVVKGQPYPVPDGAVIGLGPEVKIKFELTLQDISTRPSGD